MHQVYIGFDPRQTDAFAVARGSIQQHSLDTIRIYGVVKSRLERMGIYKRPTKTENGLLWDVISDAPMSTEFAISRFFVPKLDGGGWALFVDGDVMARANMEELFALADDRYAVMCVKHEFAPPVGEKMDGQVQLQYERKNWSSVMLFNVEHPSNKALTLDLINTVPGRDLHRFCWLKDEEIGALPPEWNYLVGHTKNVPNPKLVHFTNGTPSMKGYENCEYADEWRAELERWASC